MTFLVALAAIAVPLAAADHAPGGVADLDAIDRAVAGFTGAAIGDPGGAGTPVDRRLRLHACDAELVLGWRAPRHDTVIVRCPVVGGGGVGWTLYVPVSAGAEAVAAPPAISRGDAVSIAVTGDGFTVAESGSALESGAIGAWIKVVPASDKRANPGDALRAQVVRPGLVALTLP